MRLSELKNLNIQNYNTMTEQQLLKAVKDAAKLVNPKINTISKHKNIAQDAVEYIEKTGGLINTVGRKREVDGQVTYRKNRNELLHELKRAQYFVNLRTSTVQGAREEQKRRENIVKDKYDKDLNNKIERIIEEFGDTDDFKDLSEKEKRKKAMDKIVSDEWDNFHRFMENNPNYDSKRLLEIYKSSNYQLLKAQTELDQYKQEEWERLQNAYKEAEQITKYKSEWEF